MGRTKRTQPHPKTQSKPVSVRLALYQPEPTPILTNRRRKQEQDTEPTKVRTVPTQNLPTKVLWVRPPPRAPAFVEAATGAPRRLDLLVAGGSFWV